MRYEKDLAKPYKSGLKLLDKVNVLITYLYVGNSLEHEGYTYKMDGDFNLYVLLRGEQDVPIISNDVFWNVLIDMVNDMTEEEYKEIHFEVAAIKTLN